MQRQLTGIAPTTKRVQNDMTKHIRRQRDPDILFVQAGRLFSRRLDVITLCICLFGMSGCDWMGWYEKEKWIAATSRPGWDTFTFKGQLPAEFGIDAIAFYGPNDLDKASCQTVVFDEPGKAVVRRHVEQYTAEIKGQAQDFSFEIPLSYYKGLCGMSLGRVKLEINARYGSQDWQQAYGRGGFYFVKNTKPETIKLGEDGLLDISSTCTWLFQQSKARSILGEIEKRLMCTGAGAEFTAHNITSKTINLHIEVNPQERPSMRNRWIKTDTGWMPCQPTEKSDRCQTPPTFKTFKMNGRTCTVYPSCKE